MMGQLDSELATSLPDHAKISQLKHSLEEKIDTLKLLDAEILNHIDDEQLTPMRLNNQMTSEVQSMQPSSGLRSVPLEHLACSLGVPRLALTL